MALNTLINTTAINGVKLMTNHQRPINKMTGEVDWDKFDDMRITHPICVDHNKNMISFKIQSAPVKDVGVNGCQVADMIAVARTIIKKLNDGHPCRENAMTITKLDEALMWQERRTKDRIQRGVEGTKEI